MLVIIIIKVFTLKVMMAKEQILSFRTGPECVIYGYVPGCGENVITVRDTLQKCKSPRKQDVYGVSPTGAVPGWVRKNRYNPAVSPLGKSVQLSI